MSNGFVVNEERALDAFVFAENGASKVNGVVFYVVVCQHDPALDGVGSHGGFLCANARQALDGAKQANELAEPDHPCRYVPVGVIVDARTYVELLLSFSRKGPDDDDEEEEGTLPHGG